MCAHSEPVLYSASLCAGGRAAFFLRACATLLYFFCAKTTMEKEKPQREGGLKGGPVKVADFRAFRARALRRDMKPILDFVSSRLSFLEPKLQGDGSAFKSELRAHILEVLNNDKLKISGVEYGDKKESENLTSMIYIFVGRKDSPEEREKQMDKMIIWCKMVATSDMEFLQKIRDKLRADEPLSTGEIDEVLSMKQGDWHSRYIKEVA